ncbi:hypothetical protein CC86DRAFT_435932 [Ophiobolus disseminans]|uniref:Uncharacterized protein n=1 Tax=Ophiobolus disseminans TaxID=1469910 RepID=A0A6A7A9E4_9PLEO|nr:hypothetical protein CC86DRAFT_435932 [Ophiobolus disseminans]
MPHLTPHVGFLITHHIFFLPPNAKVDTFTSCIYPTLEAAQRDAHILLVKSVNWYTRLGYHGTYRADIDLTMRGLITAYIPRVGIGSDEHRLGEFVISAVELGSAPHMGGQEERALFADGDEGKKAVIRVPSASGAGGHVGEMQMKCVPDLALEKSYKWTQTRIEYSRRRDEGPFRREGAYDEEMDRSAGGGWR